VLPPLVVTYPNSPVGQENYSPEKPGHLNSRPPLGSQYGDRLGDPPPQPTRLEFHFLLRKRLVKKLSNPRLTLRDMNPLSQWGSLLKERMSILPPHPRFPLRNLGIPPHRLNQGALLQKRTVVVLLKKLPRKLKR